MGDMADEGGGEGEMGDILDPSMMEGAGGGQVNKYNLKNITYISIRWYDSVVFMTILKCEIVPTCPKRH